MNDSKEEKPQIKMTYLGEKKWDGPEMQIGEDAEPAVYFEMLKGKKPEIYRHLIGLIKSLLK